MLVALISSSQQTSFAGGGAPWNLSQAEEKNIMRKLGMWSVGVLVVGLLTGSVPLKAQRESKNEAPMYIYVSDWAVPRAQWGDMTKLSEQDKALEEKLLAAGTITGYGHDVNLIHSEDQPTHSGWMTASSEGNILKALAAFYAAPGATSPVLAASKHHDVFLMSRIHNSRSGSFDGAYLAGSLWKVKPGQMKSFIAIIKTRVVPVLEKELANGSLIAYNVATLYYHTEAPGTVQLVSIATDAAAVDKVDAALDAAFDKDEEIGPAIGALTMRDSHRDFLVRVTHMEIK